MSGADELLARQMLGAYATGWILFDAGGETPLEWRTVELRGIIRPSEALVAKVRRSIRVNRLKFEVRFDTDFESVLHHCSRPGNLSWMTERLRGGYRALRAAGLARSIAVYDTAGELVGGALNVTVARAAFSESSFSYAPSAGNAAMLGVLELQVREGRTLVDMGYLHNDHYRRFGAIEIDRETYLTELRDALMPPEPRVVHVPSRRPNGSA